jgi:hypothetical protein
MLLMKNEKYYIYNTFTASNTKQHSQRMPTNPVCTAPSSSTSEHINFSNSTRNNPFSGHTTGTPVAAQDFVGRGDQPGSLSPECSTCICEEQKESKYIDQVLIERRQTYVISTSDQLPPQHHHGFSPPSSQTERNLSE